MLTAMAILAWEIVTRYVLNEHDDNSKKIVISMSYVLLGHFTA